MNLFNRAFLYVRRKRSKTLILFFVLLVLATFVLSGVSVKRASETAALNIRQSLGGKFGISIDKTNSDNFQPIKEGKSSVQYIGEPIDNSVINKIMEIDGIDNYNAYYSGQALLKSEKSEYLKLIQTNDRYQDDERMQHTIASEANTESKHSIYFENGTLELAQGSHIKSTDQNVTLISKELAALNDLRIGDTLTIESTESKQSVNLKIIGIFTILEPQLGIEAAPPASLNYNRIFTDIDSAGIIYNTKDGNYNKVDFYVNDPAQMDAIIDQITQNPAVDMTDFTIDSNDVAYQKSVKPLKSMNSLLSTLLFVMVIASAVVLSLILTLWMKSRIYETGVFLSAGIGKWKIVLQHIIEILMIAVFAFCISFFASSAIAQVVGDIMLQTNTEQTSSSGQPVSDNNSTFVEKDTVITKLNINVSADDVMLVYGIGVLVIVLSVGISSIPILRLKPKEILTKIS